MPSRPSVLTRRELVVAGTALASAAFVPTAWGRILTKDPALGPGLFADGVASGEPAADAMTFWSRLTTERARSGAELVVAEDEGLTRTVATTVVPTSRAIDGSLKTRVSGLKPDTVYFYAWRSGDGVSPVGRTKTAPPADSDQPLNLAYSSCQNYPVGFFNGHREAAGLPPLDLYLFLGDYTYETENSEVRDSPGNTNDLASYRAKLKLYRSDPALRELHRLHPIVHIWDDHEVADNYNEPEGKRATPAQRAFGYRTSFEWLPRMAFPEERFRIYKPFVLGRQAEVILLDQRQYREGDIDRKPRRLLGRTQMDFLKRRLSESQARWKIIGNQVMIAPLEAGVAGNGEPVNPDQWDGYLEDRQELIDHIAKSRPGGIDDVVFITGDIHTYMANEVRLDPDGASSPSIATEFIGGSITSGGIPDAGGAFERGVLAANPWIKQFNGVDHGYAKLDLSATEAKVDYRVSDITKQDAPSRTLAAYRQVPGENNFTRVASGRRLNADAPPPPTAAELSSRRAETPELARRRRRFERFVRAQEAGR